MHASVKVNIVLSMIKLLACIKMKKGQLDFLHRTAPIILAGLNLAVNMFYDNDKTLLSYVFLSFTKLGGNLIQTKKTFITQYSTYRLRALLAR